jgi:hypothetical protein
MRTKRFVLDSNGDKVWGQLHSLLEKHEVDIMGRPVRDRKGRDLMIPAGTPMFNKDGTPMMGWLEEWVQEGEGGIGGPGGYFGHSAY